MTLLDTVRETIHKHHLIPHGSTVVVGVSGGADSLALLHILHRLSKPLEFNLHAATLDHMIRGEASAEDARFVVETCEAWGIPVTMEQINVPERTRKYGDTWANVGVEAFARGERYQFLRRVAMSTQAKYIAVAHHADDQAETILMHIMRGTGVRGLHGMERDSEIDDIGEWKLRLIRPLLNVRRSQIEEYCRDNTLETRHDATNDDTDYTRNYIRHEVLPRLAKINPQITDALTRLSAITVAENDYLEQQSAKMIRRYTHKIADTKRKFHVVIDREPFRKMHPALRQRMLQGLIHWIDTGDNLSYERILAAVELGMHGKQGSIIEFQRGYQMRVEYDTLIIENRDFQPFIKGQYLHNKEDIVPLMIPGVTSIPNMQWSISAALAPETNTPAARVIVHENSTALLRSRRDGDRFAPLGMRGHTQKISDWMINRKIALALRDHIPLLIIDDEIASVCHGAQWSVSENFAVRNDASRIIYFSFRQE